MKDICLNSYLGKKHCNNEQVSEQQLMIEIDSVALKEYDDSILEVKKTSLILLEQPTRAFKHVKHELVYRWYKTSQGKMAMSYR